MASTERDMLRSVLSNEECSKVPEDIREKIESYIKNKGEESVVSKALLETTRANLGKQLGGGGSDWYILELNVVCKCSGQLAVIWYDMYNMREEVNAADKGVCERLRKFPHNP